MHSCSEYALELFVQVIPDKNIYFLAELPVVIRLSISFLGGQDKHKGLSKICQEVFFLFHYQSFLLVLTGWASRVYYSDNGSTAVEIALKMAFRKFVHDHGIFLNSQKDVPNTTDFQLKVLYYTF